MGGEKLLVLLSVGWLLGSPPHGRGKETSMSARAYSRGITPAWAGKSRAKFRANSNQRDHPRMGGEKQAAPASLMWSAGSPPHGRGKGATPSSGQYAQRITPAWAGKRVFSTGPCCPIQDHPRMGGEKARTVGSVSSARGSPPHGRGKARHD